MYLWIRRYNESPPRIELIAMHGLQFAEKMFTNRPRDRETRRDDSAQNGSRQDAMKHIAREQLRDMKRSLVHSLRSDSLEFIDSVRAADSGF
jgi:hypothetical protein